MIHRAKRKIIGSSFIDGGYTPYYFEIPPGTYYLIAHFQIRQYLLDIKVGCGN